MWIGATIASAQMSANPTLCNLTVRVIAVVQNHELYVTKDRFHRVVIRTAFGQADPMKLQVMHGLSGLVRLTRMRAILIQSNPEGSVRIPMPNATHELIDVVSALAWQKHPMHLAAHSIVAQKQIKASACFLVTQQH